MRQAAQTSGTVIARSTPHGFWRFSANYLLAAEITFAQLRENGQIFYPVLQLYATSIELGLKAFLLKRGATLNQVRSLSHNLTKILSEARRRKLGRLVKLDAREIAAIHVLDWNYSSHQLRYIVAGTTTLPQPIYLDRAARKIVEGLELSCTGFSGRLRHAA